MYIVLTNVPSMSVMFCARQTIPFTNQMERRSTPRSQSNETYSEISMYMLSVTYTEDKTTLMFTRHIAADHKNQRMPPSYAPSPPPPSKKKKEKKEKKGKRNTQKKRQYTNDESARYIYIYYVYSSKSSSMSDRINYAAGDAEYTVMDAALNLRVQILPCDQHGRDITAGMIRSKYSQGTKQKTSSTMSCNNNKQNQNTTTLS